jgi:hypothetical protein
VATGLALTLGGGGSGGTGGSAGGPPVNRRLLAMIPAVVRHSCHSITYGDPTARASLECEGASLSVTYNLFPSAAVLGGWYIEQRDGVGIAPGSGSCRPVSFRGEGSYPGGKYFCFVNGHDPTLVWTEPRTAVGATANIYGKAGPSAAASLLRQWRCCLRGPS